MYYGGRKSETTSVKIKIAENNFILTHWFSLLTSFVSLIGFSIILRSNQLHDGWKQQPTSHWPHGHQRERHFQWKRRFWRRISHFSSSCQPRSRKPMTTRPTRTTSSLQESGRNKLQRRTFLRRLLLSRRLRCLLSASPVRPSSIEAPLANVVAKDPVVLNRLMEKVAKLEASELAAASPPTTAMSTVARNKPPLPLICSVAAMVHSCRSLPQSNEEDKENKA